jgi:E3 ubiquitin-protein ligase HECTD2
MTSEKAATNGNPSVSGQDKDPKQIFKRLDDYVVSTFTSFQCLNTSFVPDRASMRAHSVQESIRRRPPEQPKENVPKEPNTGEYPVPDLDPKLLLLGDFAENGSWWTGGQEEYKMPVRAPSKKAVADGPSFVSHRSPRLDWEELDAWYETVINCASSWRDLFNDLAKSEESLTPASYDLQAIELRLLQAQEHTQRNLLKATESLLKRPGRPISRPSELRFFLVLLANPLLYASHKTFEGKYDHPSLRLARTRNEDLRGSGPASGRYSGVIKRILGLMSNTPPDCHNYLISWFAKYPEPRFAKLKDLVGGFLAYRLRRQHEKKHEVKVDVTEGLIPSMSAGRSAATLHDTLRPNTGSTKKRKEPAKKQVYHDDWQIRAAAQVMALIFAANNVNCARKNTLSGPAAQNENNGTISRHNVHARGQLLPTSDFYTSLLDDMDLVADFEAWGHKKGKFSFCQYPFLLSIWAKIQILEYDTRRQMQVKARDAFFDSILSRGTLLSQYLILEVRRDCLVEDSLKAVSEVIGSGTEDIKKGLRIVFKGEEGVDIGGIRKEWFLLLVREVFNPNHGE